MMTRTVYLHIGMPKAASTSIQATMAGYSDARLRYAEMGDPNHSALFHTLFATDRNAGRRDSRAGRTEAIMAQKRIEYEAVFNNALTLDDRSVIFSGEVLSNLKETELEVVKARLEEHFDDIRIIAYARRPVEYTSSHFQEMLKSGRSEFKINPPDYERFFRKFLDKFGPEKCSVRLLRPETLAGGDVITDFCDQVGIDASTVEVKRANESLCAEVMAMLYVWNKDGFPYEGNAEQYGAWKMLFRSLKEIKGSKFRLPKKLVYRQISQTAVPWFEETFGYDLTESDKPRDGYKVVANQAQMQKLAVASSHMLDGLIEAEELAVPEDAPSTIKLNALYAKQLTLRWQKRFRAQEKRAARKAAARSADASP